VARRLRVWLVVTGAIVVALAGNAAVAGAKRTSFLIVPGKSIGPIRIGESEHAARAALGREQKLEGAPDVHYFPHLALFVNFSAGRVAEVRAALSAPGSPTILYKYETKKHFGLINRFNLFKSLYPRHSCKTFGYKGGPDGDQPYDNTNCRVREAGGNYTDFDFVGPANAEPDCYGITVYAKSVAAPL
jgi:hypothetical protein